MFNMMLIRPLILVSLAVAVPLSAASAQAPCTSTFDCAQRAVEAAARAEAAVAALSQKIDRFAEALKCDKAEATSPHVRNPNATAKIPAKTRVTGGGCEVPGGHAQYGHNPPVYKSMPVADGWYCEGGDPPGIPLPFTLKAYVVYCSIDPR